MNNRKILRLHLIKGGPISIKIIEDENKIILRKYLSSYLIKTHIPYFKQDTGS